MPQNGGPHRGGGRFSVSAGNGDAVFHPHQFCKHFRTRDDRNVQLFCFHHFRIIVMDCGRDNNNINIFQIIG